MSDDSEGQIATELVEQIQKGDLASEARMVSRYKDGLFFMLRKSSNADIADEVSQETWAVVLQKVREGAINDPQKLAAYIVQIGRNQLIMYFRKNARNQGLDGQEASIEDQSIQSNAYASYESEELTASVRQVLEELDTDRDKELLIRFYLREEDKSKVCSDLGLSAEHFSRVLYRAKGRLRNILAERKEEFL